MRREVSMGETYVYDFVGSFSSGAKIVPGDLGVADLVTMKMVSGANSVRKRRPWLAIRASWSLAI